MLGGAVSFKTKCTYTHTHSHTPFPLFRSAPVPAGTVAKPAKFNLITEIFFLTHRALFSGFFVCYESYKDLSQAYHSALQGKQPHTMEHAKIELEVRSVLP
jgi:hypothetical protein